MDGTVGKTEKIAVPLSYADRLLEELEQHESRMMSVLSASSVINIDPNRNSRGGVAFIGFATWGWGVSDAALESARMGLIPDVSDWFTRVRLLFPHPVPRVEKQLGDSEKLLGRWLQRKRSSSDHSVPSTIQAALNNAETHFSQLRGLFDLLPPDEHRTRVVIDTNALIDNPDVDLYTQALGPKYFVHIAPVVLRELDDLKRNGRNEQVRELARKADQRLKKYQDNGDVLRGAKVAGQVFVKFEHIEPKQEGLPTWLDLDTPDDRLVASALLLQSKHPGSAFYVITNDLNMRNKLSAVGMPYLSGTKNA